jgi:hypothetical protein
MEVLGLLVLEDAQSTNRMHVWRARNGSINFDFVKFLPCLFIFPRYNRHRKYTVCIY